MRHHRLIIPVVAGLLVASCGGDDDSSSDATDAAPAATSDGAVSDPTVAAPAPAPDTAESSAASTAPAEPAAEPSGTLRFAMTSIPSSMDPAFAGLDANLIFLTTTYDGLIRTGDEGELAPGLATEWSLSDDGLTFEMTLREGVTFQDDTPFDADAVVANIEHVKADDSLIAPTLAFIDSVEAVDPTTVRFTLSRPGGDLPELLRGYAGLMASPTALAAGTLGQAPVGAGPFRVTAMTDTNIVYERWDGYWNADQVSLASVEIAVMTDDIARLNAARSDQLDGTFVRPDQVAEAESAGLQTVTGPPTTIYGLSLNPSIPQFENAEVRKAISMAIDRDSINSFLFADACEPTVQLFAPTFWAYSDDIDDAELLTYNPDGASAILEQEAPGGITMTLLVSPITAYQRLAEVLQQQFAEVGVTMQIETVDTADRDAHRRAGDYEAILSPLYPANPDPSTFAEQFYRLAPGSTEYVDPTLPDLIAETRLTVDREERSAAIGEITATVLEAGTPTVGVCIPSLTYVFDESVSGFETVSQAGVDFRRMAMTG